DLLLFAAAGDGQDPDALTRRWTPHISGQITTIPLACSHARITAPEASREIAAVLAPLIRSNLPGPDEELVAAK
ncbi:MAG: hypothetical protein ACREFD_05795, partial [Stellaceae bacterium]